MKSLEFIEAGKLSVGQEVMTPNGAAKLLEVHSGTLVYEGCYMKMGAGGKERVVQVVISDETKKIVTILTNLAR